MKYDKTKKKLGLLAKVKRQIRIIIGVSAFKSSVF